MVNVHKTEEITYTSVKTPVTRSTVETNTNPQDALYLQTKDLVLKAEDCTETAIETLEEIQSTAAEIQEDLNAKKDAILHEITVQKQAACNDISEAGTEYIELAEEKVNEIMELDPVNRNLSNITTNGINVIKQSLSAEIGSINNTLNTKLNIADIKSYVTTTYQNGASGYRIWSDGFCEQWGSAISTTITFLKAFKDTNYKFLVYWNNTNNTNAYHTAAYYLTNKTKSNCTLAASFGGDWYAKGYIN